MSEYFYVIRCGSARATCPPKKETEESGMTPAPPARMLSPGDHFGQIAEGVEVVETVAAGKENTRSILYEWWTQ